MPIILWSNGCFVIIVKKHAENCCPKEWEACGASYIHVVDLDGALAGRMVNEEAIRNIIKSVNVPVQTGGGIRTPQDVEMKLNMGISRVIIGTKAVENPAFVKEMVQSFGAEEIVVGIDARLCGS